MTNLATDVCACTARRYERCPHCFTYAHKDHPRCDNQHHAFEPAPTPEEKL